MRTTTCKHKFVTTVPDTLEDGVLYLALDYRTAVHKCFCGCGSEVATALSPIDWKVTYDGVSVSLHPSVGNWALDCRSHYWIERNKVHWADQWSKEQIEAGRAKDRMDKERYYGRQTPVRQPVQTPEVSNGGLFGWIKRWFD